jgi:hypothetical protein
LKEGVEWKNIKLSFKTNGTICATLDFMTN